MENQRHAFAVPASGITSLPDVDSSRFAGCTSGMRKVRLEPRARGVLIASQELFDGFPISTEVEFATQISPK